MDYTPDGLLEMNNYFESYNTEVIHGKNNHKVYPVRIYTREQIMMFLHRQFGHMFGIGAGKKFGKAYKRSVHGRPILGTMKLNLLIHLKSELHPEQVQLQKGKWRSMGSDGVSFHYDKNIGKLKIRVRYKDFSVAEANICWQLSLWHYYPNFTKRAKSRCGVQLLLCSTFRTG
jgi:hypothetical protein